jgi:hypothetical protein
MNGDTPAHPLVFWSRCQIDSDELREPAGFLQGRELSPAKVLLALLLADEVEEISGHCSTSGRSRMLNDFSQSCLLQS